MESDRPYTRDLTQSVPLEDVSSSEKLSNEIWLNAGTSTGLSWIILNFALLFKLTESLGNHFVSNYAVNCLNCQFVKIRNPTISDAILHFTS